MKYANDGYLRTYLQDIQAQSFEVYCLGMHDLLKLLKMPQFGAWFIQDFAPDHDYTQTIEAISQLSSWKSFRTVHLCPTDPDFETYLYYEELRLKDLLNLDLLSLFFCPETQTPTAKYPFAQPTAVSIMFEY